MVLGVAECTDGICCCRVITLPITISSPRTAVGFANKQLQIVLYYYIIIKLYSKSASALKLNETPYLLLTLTLTITFDLLTQNHVIPYTKCEHFGIVRF